jgi:RNA methyltransferase, TrmH family
MCLCPPLTSRWAMANPPMITSSSNPKIQRVRALLNRRQEREAQGAFVVEGVRLVEEALAARWKPELVLFTGQLSERGQQVVRGFQKGRTEVAEVPAHLMEQITGTEAPQGLLAVFKQQALPLPDDLNFVVIADNLRDPGNLGTLLRSAAAAGAQAVLLSPGTTDPFAPKVVRAGMGVHFRLPVLQTGWEAIRVICKQQAQPPLEIFLAEAGEGAACWDLNLRNPLALIVGGEADGASHEAHALTDRPITVPMPGKIESLNAAAAASILLFEVVRQRRR